MPNQLEVDPHEAYLDAVFARIDRIRQMDISVLTNRYGVHPAALIPVDGNASPSWAVERILADADAQRAELREHLDGLTREYVSEGLTYEAAVENAQETLGPTAILAERISQSTGQAALGIDRRWMPLLRSMGWSSRLIFLALVPADFAIYRMHLPFLAILIFAVVLLGMLGFLQGYAAGMTITHELFMLLKETAMDIKRIRNLPTISKLTLRQHFNRYRLWHVEVSLSSIYANSRAAIVDGSLTLWSVVLDIVVIILISVFLIQGPLSKVIFTSLIVANCLRKFGCNVGARRRRNGGQNAKRA